MSLSLTYFTSIQLANHVIYIIEPIPFQKETCSYCTCYHCQNTWTCYLVAATDVTLTESAGTTFVSSLYSTQSTELNCQNMYVKPCKIKMVVFSVCLGYQQAHLCKNSINTCTNKEADWKLHHVKGSEMEM